MTTFEVSSGYQQPGGWCLTVVGDVDLVTAPDLIKEGTGALNKPDIPNLDVDLAGVTFMDSTGLGALVQLRNLAEDKGIDLRISAVSKSVNRAMSLTGLTEIFGLTGTSDSPDPETSSK